MIDPCEFADRQFELTAEFAKYLVEHPEVDSRLPEEAFIYFQIDGESEFNRYSRELAQRRSRDDGLTPVTVHVKGLFPPQGSRLIEPTISAGATDG